MYSNEKMLKLFEEKQRREEEKRLDSVRKQWVREQRALIKHEERKSKMIADYERNRAQEIAQKQRLQQNENNSPQRRLDYKYEELETSSSKYPRSTIIEEKELKKIKVKVYYEETHKTGNKNVSTDKIERDICNPVLQRGKKKQLSDEESIDIQKNISIDRLHKSRSRQDDQYSNSRLHKSKSRQDDQYSNSRLHKSRSRQDDQYSNSRLHKSTSRQDDQKDDKYINENKKSRSTRKNEEEDRNRNERTKSLSRCNNDIACVLEDRSSSHRSRSNSFSSRAAKEEQNFNENKFSSRRNQPYKPYDRVLHEELTTSYFPLHNFHNAYMHFPGPMPMYRMQAPPIMWPTMPRQFPAPFSPNMIRWRPNPPRFPNANRRFHGNSY